MYSPLKRARKQRKMSLQYVADIVGTSLSNVSRIENGKRIPTKNLLRNLILLFAEEGITANHIIFPEQYEESEQNTDSPLKLARKKRGLRLHQVAIMTGSDIGNISRIENGKQIPEKKLMASLIDIFAEEGITANHIVFPERYLND